MNPPLPDPADVVRVDRDADGEKSLVVHAVVRSGAPQRLGEQHGGSAVQQSIGLDGSLIDGHSRRYPVVAYLRELDTNMRDRRAGGHGLKIGERGATIPNGCH